MQPPVIARHPMARRTSACLLAALALSLAVPVSAAAQSLATVLQWNRTMLTTVAAPGANPPTVFATRPHAITMAAVFDAANSFDQRYAPYTLAVTPAAGASRDAAVAQAAHDVLVALCPTQTAALDAALATSLAGIPRQAAADGAAVGAAVAKATLDRRADDGWGGPFPEYVLPTLPGYWQPTPPANSTATLTNYPHVRGFIVDNGHHFLPEGPPALTSERYAADFNQVKAWGAVNSSVRSAEQTQVSQLWAAIGTTTGFFGTWNQVLGSLAEAQGWSGVDAARGFALLNMAEHDGLMTTFTGKFIYGLWRPVTAVRQADTDGNAATAADPGWLPLLPTPPYPSAPGNLACVGAVSGRVLERLFGRDNIPFSITWTGAGTNPSVTRNFSGFRQAADEAAYSRIWGGIHFLHETLASIGACGRLGDYAVDNVLRPR
jgi:hypothetical protein